MGLLQKALRFRTRKEEGRSSPASAGVQEFLLRLCGDTRPDLQAEGVLSFFAGRFGLSRILLNFLDDDENVYKLLGSRGVSAEDRKFFNISYYSNFLRAVSGDRIRLSDLLVEPKYKDELNKFIEYGIETIFPLTVEDELKGFIACDRPDWNDREREEIRRLNRIIASTLNNSMRLSSTECKMDNIREEHRNFVILFENMKNIALAEDLEEALILFMKTIKDFYSVTAANFMLRDKRSGMFYVKKSIGLSSQTDSGLKLSLSDPVFSSIIELGEPMLIPDFRELDLVKKGVAASDRPGLKFFYSVPVKLSNECYGLFNIFGLAGHDGEEVPPVLEKIFSTLPLALLPYAVSELKQ